jgi:antitoxin HigA-1
MKKIDAFAPIHPGEVLLEEYLKPLGISQNKLALAMRVSPQRINEIINGKRSMTAETAIRLAKAIGTTPEFWLSLQDEYDLQVTKSNIGSQIDNEVKIINA